MNMIRRNMPLDNVNILSGTNFTDYFSNSVGNLPVQNFFPVFRDPNQMEVNHKFCMGPVPVFTHTAQGN